MGLLIQRNHHRLPMLRMSWLALSAALVVAFALPTWTPVGGVHWNGIYEAACVLVLFPLIVWAGAHSTVGHGAKKACYWAGVLSFPLYLTHYPACYVWMNYVDLHHPGALASILIGTGIVAMAIAVAVAADRWWDRPIRAWLAPRADPPHNQAWRQEALHACAGPSLHARLVRPNIRKY
jgi:peptidoglycan/LPS O-acetylase OafA/YrhL